MKFRLTYILFLLLLSCSEKRSDENHVKILKESWNQQKEKEKSDLFSFNSNKYALEFEIRQASGAYQDYIFLKRNLNLDEDETRLMITRSDFENFLSMTDSITKIEDVREFDLTFDDEKLDQFFKNRSVLSYYLMLDEINRCNYAVVRRLASLHWPFCGFTIYPDEFKRKLLFYSHDCDCQGVYHFKKLHEYDCSYIYKRKILDKTRVQLLLMDLNKPMYTFGEYKLDSVQVFDSEGKAIKYDRKKFKSSYLLNFHTQDTGMFTVRNLRKIFLNSDGYFVRKDTLLTVDQEIRLRVE
ncbi:hypothetical protein [Aureibacter tunicatorum]|uniref:Uncharacterized protein n=1 Tax=Aureibacter tunicatorum TaxID=866807 RepID=A0AAE3XP48_9BACT|nr:hypothetical protein [Aureibacter tunicatorum]MDR6240065.1 hypothetical protein [Aureibacter tunicatorum]BDD04537.1 hypothetical protein AUTU_20200 [Aureibacter tunicatorum]